MALAWRVVPAFLAASRQPQPATIRAAVKRGVLSLVLLDAASRLRSRVQSMRRRVLATGLVAGWLARDVCGDLELAPAVPGSHPGSHGTAKPLESWLNCPQTMDSPRTRIRVTFRYPVYFSRDVFAPSNPLVLKAAPSAGRAETGAHPVRA